MDDLRPYLATKLPQYLDDLRTLVSIDSGSDDKGGVDRVVDWLLARLTQLGFTCERLAQPVLGDNLRATLQGQGAKRILLLGHSDTVFPKGTAAQRPLQIQGPKILGPGVCDMKGGLLAGLYAVEALQAAGFRDFGEIVFLCVSDEEIGQRASVPLIRETARRVDAAFTLEAARANGDIVTARKTVRWCTLEAFGKAAHAGVEPEKGRNAILALARHLDALDRLNGFRPGVTVNTGVIEGGRQPNVVPDYAKAGLDLRAWRQVDMEDLLRAIRAQLETPAVQDVRMNFVADVNSGMPAMERTPKVMALEALTQAVAAGLDFTVKGAATGGASDASFVAAEGTPVLDGLGPVGGLDHGPDEYIELESIVPRTALLAGVMRALCR
jgi:glutamate carboxypeptidase